MKAVILAGGEGRRLLPYTTTFPKPMVPVGNRPMLEILLRQLRANGIRDVIVATGYLDEIIRTSLGDGAALDVSIIYSKESRPLGTAGPLDLVRDRLHETFLLINGDVLADLDFARLVRAHRERASDVTIVLARRTETVDFGLVAIDAQQRFVAWDEKPVREHLVSAGIYLVEPRVLAHLPVDTTINLPDFIVALHHAGCVLHGYVHEGYWLDIGRPADYEQACRDVERLGLW
ncbi:NTP transferase domain-containing protein [Candidatus Binatia bacterium]|nr:NTP transferase domain-containing protein [Candidatus Binatia bacterium]